MQRITGKQLVLMTSAALLFAHAGFAKTRLSELEPCVKVVGHLSLDGVTADRLFVRQSSRGKRYLYAIPADGRAVSVINISDPSHPAAAGRLSSEADGGAREVTPVGLNAAIVEISDHPGSSPSGQPEPRSIGIMDLSDPGNPKIACRFTGVTSYLVDDARSLIYIVNGEGLWVVRHQEPPDISVQAWEQFAAAP
jgi:hypothetical protein